ncbi:MAG: outer membrane beta-barrel protein [Rubellimicrobium sp.]|nr:outer membrane beta-barrel protein [Rubellimicrobium sp.]
MLKRILAATAAVVLAAPAMAGGLAPAPEPVVVVPVVPAPAARDWTGFYAGVQAGQADFSNSVSSRYDSSGTYWGGHVGYLHDLGRFVLGGELRYSDASGVTNGISSFDGDTLVSGRLIAGYDAGRIMPFVAVGGGQLTLENGWKDTGILYGAGVEFAMTDHWRLGAEATHFEFKDFAGYGYDLTGNAVGIRVSYRF